MLLFISMRLCCRGICAECWLIPSFLKPRGCPALRCVCRSPHTEHGVACPPQIMVSSYEYSLAKYSSMCAVSGFCENRSRQIRRPIDVTCGNHVLPSSTTPRRTLPPCLAVTFRFLLLHIVLIMSPVANKWPSA